MNVSYLQMWLKKIKKKDDSLKTDNVNFFSNSLPSIVALHV